MVRPSDFYSFALPPNLYRLCTIVPIQLFCPPCSSVLLSTSASLLPERRLPPSDLALLRLFLTTAPSPRTGLSSKISPSEPYPRCTGTLGGVRLDVDHGSTVMLPPAGRPPPYCTTRTHIPSAVPPASPAAGLASLQLQPRREFGEDGLALGARGHEILAE